MMFPGVRFPVACTINDSSPTRCAARCLDAPLEIHRVCILDQTVFAAMPYDCLCEVNLWLGPNCLRSTSKQPPPPQLRVQFMNGL
jgi:hypothetical protein